MNKNEAILINLATIPHCSFLKKSLEIQEKLNEAGAKWYYVTKIDFKISSILISYRDDWGNELTYFPKEYSLQRAINFLKEKRHYKNIFVFDYLELKQVIKILYKASHEN